MSSSIPISLPAGFAPAFALGYAGQGGDLALVAPSTPLPVQIMNESPAETEQPAIPPPEPLEGSATGTILVGPFTPQPDRPVMLALWGEWSGTLQLERAAHSGAPRLPTTVAGAPWGRFTGNACEAVWSESEAGAQLFLSIAAASGTLNYRIAQ